MPTRVLEFPQSLMIYGHIIFKHLQGPRTSLPAVIISRYDPKLGKASLDHTKTGEILHYHAVNRKIPSSDV
jgi:hypothetical protein